MSLHITFSGDASVAGGYVGVGRTMIEEIKGSIRKEGLSVMTFPEARIEARVVGLQEYIHIEATSESCALYMESGYAQMGQYMHNRPGASIPATLQLGSVSTETHLFGTLTAGEARAVVPNSVSTSAKFKSGELSPKSFFAAPRLNETVPSSDPLEATEGSGQAGEFPIDTALERKKAVVAKVCPSIYSGKMRLFVQSLFGAPLTVFGKQAISAYEFQPNMLKKNGIILGYSTGIFTSDDGTYWLVDLGTVVTVWKIQLTTCGSALSQWLVKNPQANRHTQSEFEAFIFAEATIDTSFSFTLQNVPVVTPFAYGWKFNWGGSEATCISIGGGGTPGNLWNSATKHVVTISRNSSRVFTADEQAALSPVQMERMRWNTSTSSSAEERFVFPWGSIMMWIPLYLYGRISRASPIYPQAGVGNGTPVAIYGWYNDQDAFQSVTMSVGQSSAFGATVTGDSEVPPHSVVYDGLNSSRMTTSAGATNSNTISIAGGTYVSVFSQSTYTKNSLRANEQAVDFTPLFVPLYVPNDAVALLAEGAGYKVSYTYPTTLYATTSAYLANFVSNPYPDISALDAVAALNASQRGFLPGDYITTSYLSAAGGVVDDAGVHPIMEGYSEAGTISKDGDLAIVIPFYDSESAYIFRSQTNSQLSTSSSHTVYTPTDGHGFSGACSFTTNWGATAYHSQWKRWMSMTDFGVVSTEAMPPTVNVDHQEEMWCYLKNRKVKATTNSLAELFDPSYANQLLDNEYFMTFTSASLNYVTGYNIDPAEAFMPSDSGTFIGWF